MNILEKRTYKLLKRIKDLESFDLKISDLPDVSILNSEGYILTFGSLTAENLIKSANWMNYFVITPKGKLYLSTYKHLRLKFIIPIAFSTSISIISLVISIIALLKK